MALCVIPARGGSKRIPRKNVREFCGRPMIAWSISAALESRCFDRVIVSTDDEEIAEVARAAGAETPFMRSGALADDYTPTRPVVADAIAQLGETDFVCCLYATAPFVLGEDLACGHRSVAEENVTYAFSVVEFGFPIQRALRMRENNAVEAMNPEHSETRSQDLEPAWHDAGQFYWARASQWCTEAPIFGPGAVGIALPRKRVQDIDTEEDWQLAELMFKAQGLGNLAANQQ